jgi:tRNA modification GTPase
MVMTRQRHQDCISRMVNHAETAFEMIGAGEPDECIAVELQDGLVSLGELLGEDVGDDLLDSIFSEFCIGK